MQAVQDDVPNDLPRLPSLEEDRVRHALELRFQANKIYTHINSLLGAQPPGVTYTCALHMSASLCPQLVTVALNPYKILPLYDKTNLEAYNQYGVSSVCAALPIHQQMQTRAHEAVYAAQRHGHR